jgi:hypothetical protein
VLFFVSMSLFGPTLKNPFLADDYIWTKYVASFNNFGQFAQNAFTPAETDFRYRPLMPTGVRLCYQISGTDPFCTHLVSFTFHFINTLLIGKLSYLLTKNKRAAWAAMLFFAVYFPHVVSVVWMSDLGNPLAAFFALATVIFFYGFITTRNYVWWGVSLVTIILATISKESALALGPILITWGFILFWKKPDGVNRKLILLAGSSYIALGGVYLGLVNRTGLIFAVSGSGNYTYRFDLNALRNIIFYPLNFIWPTHVSKLEIIYQNLFDLSRTHAGSNFELISKIAAIPNFFWVLGGTLAIWIGVLGLLLQQRLINWLTLAWIVWGLGPVIFIAGHGERHMYVASIGLSLLVGHFFFRDNFNTNAIRSFVHVAGFAALLAFNIQWTQARTHNWQLAGATAREIITTVTSQYPQMSDDAEIWFVGLPTHYEGVHFFGLGIDAAIQLAYNNLTLRVYKISNQDELPTSLQNNQYAFILKGNQLVNLTTDYQNR